MYENYLDEIHRICRRRNLSKLTETNYVKAARQLFGFVGENHNVFTLQYIPDSLESGIIFF